MALHQPLGGQTPTWTTCPSLLAWRCAQAVGLRLQRLQSGSAVRFGGLLRLVGDRALKSCDPKQGAGEGGAFGRVLALACLRARWVHSQAEPRQPASPWWEVLGGRRGWHPWGRPTTRPALPPAGGCDTRLPAVHVLERAPRVFSLQLVWPSQAEEAGDISATLAAVDERVRARPLPPPS